MTDHAGMIGLIDGNDIPIIGLGAFCRNEVDETRAVAERAIEAGIRHFEIAELFGNGHIIVDAIISCKLERSEVFITLKVWPKDRGAKDLVQSCMDALTSAGLKYADLLLIHAPIDTVNDQDQWRAVEYLQTEGLCKSVGLANLTEAKLTEVLKNSTTSGGPAVVEMEVSPYRQQEDLVGFCHDGGIIILNNNATVKGIRSDSPEVREVAEVAACSPDVALTRWNVGRGQAVLISPSLLDAPGFSVEAVSTPLDPECSKILNSLDQDLVTSYITREIAADD